MVYGYEHITVAIKGCYTVSYHSHRASYINAFNENDQTVRVFDTNPSARPLPILGRLKVIDSYYTWLRMEQ